MKFLLCSDLHLTDKQPKNRLDDYPKTQYKKMEYILEAAYDHNVISVLCGGDMFDSHKSSMSLLTKYIKLFKEYGIPIVTVAGQHDLSYHNVELSKSPLGVLRASEAIDVVSYGSPLSIYEDGHIYGSGWNQDIKEIKGDKHPLSILLTHRMVINKEKLWNDQEEYTWGSELLRKYEYDLIVSGDNHQSFINKTDGKILVNSGSLMRMTIAQIDHSPCFYIYDSDTKDVEQFLIPIALADEVFNIESVKLQKEKAEELNAFVEILGRDASVDTINFLSNLNSYVKQYPEIRPEVIKVIDNIMAQMKGNK